MRGGRFPNHEDRTAEYLLAAGKIIAVPAQWCQGALALDKFGQAVEPSSRRAVRWDSTGICYSVMRLDPDDYDDPDINEVSQCLACLDLCALRYFKMNMVAVNDRLGHAETLEVFRNGIRRARGRKLESTEARNLGAQP